MFKTPEDPRPTVYFVHNDNQIRRMFGMRGYRRVDDINLAKFVVWSGGPDVMPILYGETRHQFTSTSLRRDLEDIAALRKTKHEQYKIGICRGGQFLNVMVGNGRLYQHVVGHATGGYHDALTEDGVVIPVTSTHHQMMIPGSDGRIILGACACTRAESPSMYVSYPSNRKLADDDADPEAVLYLTDNTLCYQPHPEYFEKDNKANQDYFFSILDTYMLLPSESNALRDHVKRTPPLITKGS